MYKYPGTILRVGQLTVVAVLFALMLQCFSKMIVVAEFYANRDYIARNLCINRLNPAVHCEGRCQLDKRILQDEKNGKDKEAFRSAREEVLSSKSFFATSVVPVTVAVVRVYPIGRVAGPVDRPISIFHPPCWLLA